MWRVLTLNVEVLPLLPLEQWQILFSIIAIAASAGGFSAIKSFEVNEIPLFCAVSWPILKIPCQILRHRFSPWLGYCTSPA